MGETKKEKEKRIKEKIRGTFANKNRKASDEELKEKWKEISEGIPLEDFMRLLNQVELEEIQKPYKK